MSYTVKSSEKLRPSGANTETKALLYLMNFRDDSDEIYYFIVDFFNDLTGMTQLTGKMWDLQSKGVSNSSPNDNNIVSFLERILFVIDDKDESEYVRKIIKLSDDIIPNEETLQSIFNEIRDVQSSKKNIGVVEGKILKTPEEAIGFGRHLSVDEIKLLVLNRVLNKSVVGSSLPKSFVPVFNMYPPEKRDSLLEDCELDFSKALFDSTSQDNYWKMFETVYKIIILNPSDDVEAIFNKLDNDLKSKCRHFNVLSLKYFIAKIKDGIKI